MSHPVTANGIDANKERVVEDDFSRQDRFNSNLDSDEALNRMRTTGAMTITPELFEKLYLSPKTQVHGDLRKTFGNPTPLALIGFLISLSPLACQLMGWRGTGGPGVGAAQTAIYFFFGGILLGLAAIGEWILGNTFPFVVFGSFSAFWMGFGGTLAPAFNAWGAYATQPGNAASGLENPVFYNSYAFFFLAMAIMCLIYTVCSLRTNVAFFIIFITLTVAFSCLAGAYWQTGNGNAALAGTLQKTAGAFLLVTCASGWWIFVAIMLQTLDFPFEVPVGDLSTVIKGKSERQKLAHGAEAV